MNERKTLSVSLYAVFGTMFLIMLFDRPGVPGWVRVGLHVVLMLAIGVGIASYWVASEEEARKNK